jgi:hypothetical protein
MMNAGTQHDIPITLPESTTAQEAFAELLFLVHVQNDTSPRA